MRLPSTSRVVPRVAVASSRLLIATLAFGLLAPGEALAQRGAVPPLSHHITVDTLYAGQLRRAERGFQSELRGSIKIGLTQWIDSVCFHAMLGETYYQQGANAAALEQFDYACSLFLSYSDWLKRVKFQQPPRADAARGRLAAPWGRSSRQVVYAALPDTMLITHGRLDNSHLAEQGGVVQAPQLWKVNVVEIVRCTALAIRRRSELLGPLGPTDRLSKELADTLARGGLAPGNHWSNAWVELQLGLAQMGVGKELQAVAHLNRAVLLDGRFDHALTGAALLAQAHIARRAGNHQAAATLYAEAGIAAFRFEDFDALGESLWWGHVHHTALGAAGVYPPLEAALAWADRKNIDLLDWRLRTAAAEGLATTGQTEKAASLLAASSTRQRDLAQGRLGAPRDGVAALVLLRQNKASEGRTLLLRALEQQAGDSTTNFQTELATARFDAGSLSPRLAVEVFEKLLSDPTPQAWSVDPLDTLAHLRTSHDAAYERWFAAALGRREISSALEVSDLTKRRRFFRAQPLAGRVVALRRLLETPSEQLSKPERLERQAWLAKFPQYAKLSAQAAQANQDLAAMPLFEEDRLASKADRELKRIAKLSQQREQMMLAMALGRGPTSLGFPAVRTTAATQKLLVPGDALLVFHRSGVSLHGFLVVQSDVHHWRLPDSRAMASPVAQALRDLGNFNRSRALPHDEAQGDAWRLVARDLGKLVLGESRLDLDKVRKLTIVPDGLLWHVPFEPLIIKDGASTPTLIDAAPMRYAPTMGLAYGDNRPLRPVKKTGLAAPRAVGSTAEREAAEQQRERMTAALGEVMLLEAPLPTSSPLMAGRVDQLVVTAASDLSPTNSPYDWSPAPLDRSAARGRLGDWMALPTAAPERLVLTGVHTIAENALKTGRRRSSRSSGNQLLPGDELFHAACGILAAGPRTALLSRWTTDGGIASDLAREFASQMDKQLAADAWRRSVTLARATALEPEQEPRLEWNEKDGPPPTASHPFFWSGFLLLDTGVDPAPKPAEQDEPADEQQPAKKTGSTTQGSTRRSA